MRLLHAGHGDELCGASRAATPIPLPRMLRGRSAATSAGAAATRMSSRRRSPRQKRERPEPWPKTAPCAPRRSRSASSASALHEEPRQDPGRRAAAVAAQRRACRHRQAASAPERPGQGHRRDPLYGRRRAAGPAVRTHFALAPRARRRCAPSTLARPSAIRGCARSFARSALDDPAYSVVRYVGQPVVALAATSMAAAEEALRLIRVDYQAAALRRRSRRGAPA